MKGGSFDRKAILQSAGPGDAARRHAGGRGPREVAGVDLHLRQRSELPVCGRLRGRARVLLVQAEGLTRAPSGPEPGPSKL